MGLIASLVMERRLAMGWTSIGDLFYPFQMRRPAANRKLVQTPVTALHYATMPHNCLFVSHLLGAGVCCSEDTYPDYHDDGLRIAGKHRGIPKDAAATTKKAVGNLSHLGPDHTPSWCSLKEILAFDWTQPLSHHMYLNGPMLLEWLKNDCATLPPRYETCNNNTGKPNDSTGLIVEFDELHGLATKASSSGLPDEQRKKIAAWAEHRWAYVERDFPLLVHCSDFMGRVVGQLLDGKNPEDARVICWVS
jgi:hypothetical protein